MLEEIPEESPEEYFNVCIRIEKATDIKVQEQVPIVYIRVSPY